MDAPIAPAPDKPGAIFVIPNRPGRDFAFELTDEDVVQWMYDFHREAWREFGLINEVQKQVVRDLHAAQCELAALRSKQGPADVSPAEATTGSPEDREIIKGPPPVDRGRI